MALDRTAYSAAEWDLAIQEEDTWGTAETTAGSFKLCHLTEPPTLDLSGIIRDETPKTRDMRVPHQADNFSQLSGGSVAIDFNNILMTDITLDFFLYAVLQDLVSEQVGTPFEKIWEWDTATTSPDFGAIVAITTAGHIFTVVLKNNAIASEDRILTSAILSTLTLNSDPAAFGGRLTASGKWWSGHPVDFAPGGSQSLTGATVPGTDFYHHFGSGADATTALRLNTKTLNGKVLIIGPYSITFNNKAKRIGDAVGNAQNYVLAPNMNDMYEVVGSINVKYDSETKGFLDDWLTSGFDTQLVLAYGSGNDPVDTDGDFLMKLNVAPTGHEMDYGNELGVFLNIPFKGVDDETNEMVEIEQANAADRGWTI